MYVCVCVSQKKFWSRNEFRAVVRYLRDHNQHYVTKNPMLDNLVRLLFSYCFVPLFDVMCCCVVRLFMCSLVVVNWVALQISLIESSSTDSNLVYRMKDTRGLLEVMKARISDLVHFVSVSLLLPLLWCEAAVGCFGV